MGILDFEMFNAGHMLKKAVQNPDQLLLGAADPFGAKLWGGITGKNYEPIVNQWGGASDGAYKAAEAKGIDTTAARGAHKAAEAVASFYAGGAASNGLGSLGSAGGNAGQGLSMGASGQGLQMGGGQGLSSMGGGSGLSMGAGNGVQLSAAGTPAASTGMFSADNMKNVQDVAGMAQKAGIFDQQGGPQAQSAGIPGRGGVDFSGLLSAGRANNVSGAQLLAQQRAARRGA